MKSMRDRQAVMDNPYVVQMDRFANSLQHLSSTFLSLEKRNVSLTQAEIEEIFTEIDEKICKDCEKREWCMGENAIYTYQMVYEILSAVEEYGLELPMEVKKKTAETLYTGTAFFEGDNGSVSGGEENAVLE